MEFGELTAVLNGLAGAKVAGRWAGGFEAGWERLAWVGGVHGWLVMDTWSCLTKGVSCLLFLPLQFLSAWVWWVSLAICEYCCESNLCLLQGVLGLPHAVFFRCKTCISISGSCLELVTAESGSWVIEADGSAP